jgi:uncharacterized protein YcbX
MTSREAPVQLLSIHVYPLKGGSAVDLPGSRVEPWGLAGDRRWLLVDRKDRFITQREHPELARLTARYVDVHGATRPSLAVSAVGRPGLMMPTPAISSGPSAPETLTVTIWGSMVAAAAAGPEADAWFSAYLGEPTRLVYLDDPTQRTVDPAFGAPGDVVSFADGYPLLLTSTASLSQLNEWLSEAGDQPVPMTRFRPNLVVTAHAPWAEDGWRRIRISSVMFRVAKPCGRCVVTTIDQATGERGKQPLRVLGQRRRFGSSLVFGQNLIPDCPGEIRVGEPVEVLG